MMAHAEPKLRVLEIALSDNQRRFLNRVARNPGARRHDLADELGFSPQTAMRVVAPLVEAGILAEIDEVTGTRGKPPRLVHFAKNSLLTLAFVIARERITVSVSDLQGDVLVRETERRGFRNCQEQLSTIRRLFRTVSMTVPAHARVVSAAVSATGFFLERGRRLVARVDPAGWSKLDLRVWLEDLSGVPTLVENDTRVVTTSILETSPHSSFLTVFLDYGIGGAIVEDGRLVPGKHGNAGAVGRLFPLDAKRPTERSLREVLGLADWDEWTGLAHLTPVQIEAWEAWLDNAATQFSGALSLALALLDFEAVYICARAPDELLDALTRRIRFEPLGANIPTLDGEPQDFVLDQPIAIGRSIKDMAGMTHFLAARSFLEPDRDEACGFAVRHVPPKP